MENKLMFDDAELLKLMEEYGDSKQSLATYLGTSRQNISQVFNGQHNFTYEQIIRVGKKYSLDADGYYRIFIKPMLERIVA